MSGGFSGGFGGPNSGFGDSSGGFGTDRTNLNKNEDKSGFGNSSFGGGFGFGGGENPTGGSGFGDGGGTFGSSGGFSRGAGGKGDNACRKCGEVGHFARDCTKGVGGGARTCHKCNKEGHIARDCTESGGGGGGGNFGGSGGFGAPSGGGFGASSGGFGASSGGGFGASGGSGCRKCGEEGHFARDCPKGGGGGGGARTCHKCNKEGHIARDCTEGGGGNFGGSGGGFGGFGAESGGGFGGFGAESGGGFGGASFGGGFGDADKSRSSGCRKCGEEGHFARDCPKGGGGGGGACFNCGEEGHMSKDCPNPRKEGAGGRSSGKCFRCGEEGHISSACTNPPMEGVEDRKPASTHVPVDVAVEALWEEHIPVGINFDRYYNIPVERSGNSISDIPTITSFDEADLTPQLLINVKKAGYTRPTPIQQHAMPVISKGRDLMGCAQTGSGKTAAFMLPILSSMLKSGDMTSQFSERQEPTAIVMAPTRELAIQIQNEARKFSEETMAKVVVAYGGTAMKHQMQKLENGCNVLVATVGRLMDIVAQEKIGLAKCKYLVLDEADRMLDMGFEPEIRKLVENSEMPPKTQRQTLMFSATFPEGVQKLAVDFLNDHAFITVGKLGAANQDIVQEVIQVDKFSKKEKLLEIVKAEVENAKDENGRYSKKTMIFVERKRTADFLATFLSEAMVMSTSIHGDRLQKEREEALGDFRRGSCPILVATGVAARGLDIKGVDHVVNYDLPKDIEEYVHRIGRTGRVGNVGRATSLYDSGTDTQIAQPLVAVLVDASQVVPEWLAQDAGIGGASGGNDFGVGEATGGGGTGGGDEVW